MSDGNFNRALLPHTPYHSGLKTGRMQMRTRAEASFNSLLNKHFPETDNETKAQILREFQESLRF